MFLDAYYDESADGLRISAEQGSRFAKEVAGDYNPIHDPESKRFCVPGDLLFALVLARFGLSEHMAFHFRGMVGPDVPLRFPEAPGETMDISDARGKVYLHVERAGAMTRRMDRVEAFIRRYVSFSGRNFPHYLQPLMAEHGVMFNPDRPLVIYDSMGFRLDRLEAADPGMALADSALTVQGKRAEAQLRFRITDGDLAVGEGSKKLTISGLRPYEADVMDAFVAAFSRRAASGTE